MTVWSVISQPTGGVLAVEDEPLSAWLALTLWTRPWPRPGCFSVNSLPSGTADCLQGNLCAALVDLGVGDPRLEMPLNGWRERHRRRGRAAVRQAWFGQITPASAGPASPANRQSCAWGGQSHARVRQAAPGAMDAAHRPRGGGGVDFLFSADPAKADYPAATPPNPAGTGGSCGLVFYVTDLLQNVEALVVWATGATHGSGAQALPRKAGRAGTVGAGVRLFGEDLGGLGAEAAEQMGDVSGEAGIEGSRAIRPHSRAIGGSRPRP